MALGAIKLFFGCCSLYTGIVGVLINLYQNALPSVLVDSFLYGKFTSQTSNNAYLKLPKSWFKHFYVFASVWSSFFFILATFHYLHVIPKVPELIKYFLSYFILENQKATVSAAETILALFLITLQAFKRFYETHYVSVFSNAKIDLSHYLIGHIHYFGTVLAMIIESPGFSQAGQVHSFLIDDIPLKAVIATLIFLWAWWNQFLSASILADLRKNKKGEVVTQAHKIPHGGLFYYVSSPHSLCEIIMYFCLSVILFENETFHYITVWVLINQVETSILSHRWYHKEFKNYPKNRRALVPYIF